MPIITKPNQHFDATLYTGTSAAQTITNAGAFQPDLVWGKNRTNVNGHRLTDSVRGTGKVLFSDTTNGDTTGDGQLSSFNSNGFGLTGGTGAFEGLNQSGNNYVAWQWKAGGAAVTNTAGSIQSQVSANPTAGFSVVTYTGNNTASTVGHGLGVAPKMIIAKVKSTTGAWGVYHESITASQVLYLNVTDAADGSGIWNSTAPTSSVFSIGAHPTSNPSGQTLVAYCFSQVAGYSAFGSWTGNGSTDGPFIYTGFRTRFIMTKRSSSTGNWLMLDTSRNPYNDTNLTLAANLSGAETTGAGGNWGFDILSNGFKIRGVNSEINSSGQTYIYMAFAEAPFKFANAR